MPAQPATNLWRAIELSALIEFALPLLKNCTDILDLGCGDGGVMAILLPHLPQNACVIGIDPDEFETAMALERGIYSKVITAGAEKIPLPDSCIDAIISNSVLEHIEPINNALKESARVLRTGGWFIATVPGADFHKCLYGPLLPWIDREKYLREIDKRLAHFRYWNAEEWRQNLAEAGLNLEKAFEYLPLQAVRRWELISRFTGGLLYSITGKKASPIQIQRKMNLRRRYKIPVFVIGFISRILGAGLDIKNEKPFGGLLIAARKS